MPFLLSGEFYAELSGLDFGLKRDFAVRLGTLRADICRKRDFAVRLLNISVPSLKTKRATTRQHPLHGNHLPTQNPPEHPLRQTPWESQPISPILPGNYATQGIEKPSHMEGEFHFLAEP